MLILVVLLFSIAALLGMYLITFILQNKNTPKGIVFTHGPVAVIGLILLIFYTIFYETKFIISILVFALAASVGLILIYRDLIGKSMPKSLAIGHGLLAIIGFLFLIFYAFIS